MQSNKQIPIVDLFKNMNQICNAFIEANESLPCALTNMRTIPCTLCPLGNMPLTNLIYGEYNESI